MQAPPLSGNFLRAPNNSRKHSALISAHPAPRNLANYARRGDTDLTLVVGFNSGDNPFDQSYHQFDIRKMPDRPRLMNTIDLAHCRGLRIVGWVFLDDSPMAMEHRRVVVTQAGRRLRGLVDVWVVALEANEYLPWAQHHELGQRLRAEVGPRDIILQHLQTDWWSHTNDPDEWSEATWCNGIALQVKDDVVAKMAEFRQRIKDVRPDAFIYYGEGSTDWGQNECDRVAQDLYDRKLIDGSLHGLVTF